MKRVESYLIFESLIEVDSFDRTIDGDEVLVPIEVISSPYLKELPENIHWSVQFIIIVVQHKYH